jgi:hypothetical protein
VSQKPGMIFFMRRKPGARVRAVGRWLGDHILGALVGLAVATIGGLLIAPLFGGSATDPPSLARQWDQQRAALRRQGWEVTADQRVEMRGNTQPVTLLALRRNGECTGLAATPSDQVRIYEVDAGQLRQTFRFQPTATGCRAWTFHLAGTADLTGSGRAAVFGEFVGSPLGEPGEAIPVVIAWNERAGRYFAGPLITESPDAWLTAEHAEERPEWFQQHALQMFRKPIRLTASVREGAYGASGLRFVLRGAENSYVYGLYRLTSGVPVGTHSPNPASLSAPILYQRVMWHLETFGEGIVAGWCQLPKHRMGALVSLDDESKVLSHLVQHGRSWFNYCEAPLTSKWWKSHHPNS